MKKRKKKNIRHLVRRSQYPLRVKEPRPLIISLDGASGVGKSTQEQKLIERLGDKYPALYPTRCLFTDSSSLAEDAKRYVESSQRPDSLIELLLFSAAHRQLSKEIQTQLSSSATTKPMLYLLCRSYITTLVHADNNDIPLEDAVRYMKGTYILPDCSLTLYCDQKVAWQRKHSRTEGVGGKIELPHKHERRMNTYKRYVQQEYLPNAHLFDTHASIGEVTDILFGHIERELRKKGFISQQ